MQSGDGSVFKKFTSSEINSGLVLLACLVVSLILANLSFGEEYINFWHKEFGFPSIKLVLSNEHWINDGLMTIFFLMVGLEIERELYAGELHPIKNALLPLFAALGGMILPALIYVSFNFQSGTLSGFGIPMGTDIAFALAVLALAGKRVPASIKVLLTAIAIIDDLGSIIIIALFYGSGIQLIYLISSLAIFGILLLMNRFKVHKLWPYIILGVPMWYCMMRSGIHPTISGVLLAFAFPFSNGDDNSPSIKLQKFLHVPVAFLILPLFTLANTAIALKGNILSEIVSNESLGIGFGLLVGKPFGILIASFAAIKSGLVKLPQGASWYDLLAMGCVAGIGFTMSIFITQLAFTSDDKIQISKMMILLASTCAGISGLSFFYFKRKITPLKNQ